MKKAQATVYVIAGIVIVILASLGYMLKTKILTSDWERERTQSLAVPEYAKKVKSFTESCIAQVAQEGTTLLSAQGGYIILPEDSLPPSPANPFSNALQLFPQGGNKVAYWWYETANGIQKNQIPTLTEIKTQLQSYIDTHLDACLQEYGVLKDQGYQINSGKSKTTSEITDEKIYLTVRMPVTLTLNYQTTTLQSFYTSLEYGLGMLLKQAYNMMKTEEQRTFLEQYTLDILNVYDAIPFSGIDMECTPRTWKKIEVFTAIKHALATNIPLVKMEGTDFILSQDVNKYFIVPSKEIYVGTTTQFLYSPQWPILIDILDEEGPVVQGKPYTIGNAASPFLTQFFCLNDYHFVYDIKFPVLITISDEKNNIFQFATMVIIDNNQPLQNTFAIPAYDTTSPICENANIPLKVQAIAITQDGSLAPIPAARVSLKCVTATCHLGTTDAAGTLHATAPSCYNAALIVEKEGFHQAKEFISTNEEAIISPVLEPLYPLTVDVQVIDNTNIRPLQPTEQAIFTFEEKDREYTTSMVIPGQNTLSLIAGTYNIQSQLLVSSDPPFTIPEQNLKICNDAPQEGVLGILGFQEKKCVTQRLEQTQLPQVAAGGSTITWLASRSALASAQKITLYIVRSSSPRTLQDLTNLEKTLMENAPKTREPTLE